MGWMLVLVYVDSGLISQANALRLAYGGESLAGWLGAHDDGL